MDNSGAMPPNNPTPQPSGINPLPDFMAQPSDKPPKSPLADEGDGKFKTIIIVACAVILVSIAALILMFSSSNGNNSGNSNGNQGNNNGGSSEVNEEELAQIVRSYAANLIDKNFSSNFHLLALPKNSVITVSDYADFIGKKTNYNKINETMKVKDVTKNKEVEKEKDTPSYTVELIGSTDSDSVEIVIRLAKINDSWGVQEEGLYLSDWAIVIPGDTKLYIDGDEIPTSLVKNDDKVFKSSNKYFIPAIYPSKKNVRIVHELASKSFSIVPATADNGKEYYLELKDDKIISASYDFIKEAWNAMYKAYANGSDVSEVTKYFDDSMNKDDINKYYKEAFDTLSQGNNSSKNTNFQMTNTVVGNADCYILNKDVITINFGYQLSWGNSKQSGTQTMSRYSKLRLSYDGKNFKIFEVPDDRVFSYSSDGIKEF